MFFQLEPEKWNEHIDELEDWAIRLFASILPSDIARLKLKPAAQRADVVTSLTSYF